MGRIIAERRTELRTLQDRWLALPMVRQQIEIHGEHLPIAGHSSPTFHQVRTTLCEAWETWFRDDLQE